MDERWTPTLHLHESGGRCRLSLDGVTYGNGESLQEAADDLVARVLQLIEAMRSSGFRISGDFAPWDLRVFAYLHELEAVASRGGDIRRRIFGFSDGMDIAA